MGDGGTGPLSHSPDLFFPWDTVPVPPSHTNKKASSYASQARKYKELTLKLGYWSG